MNFFLAEFGNNGALVSADEGAADVAFEPFQAAEKAWPYARTEFVDRVWAATAQLRPGKAMLRA